MNKSPFWIITLIIVLVLFGLFLFSRANAPTTEFDANEHVKGNPNSTVTLVEYSDFQCPACAQAYPVAAALAESTDVRFIYRHFPLNSIHPNADLAARASEAAAMQDKFWDMHDVLFNTQAQWSNDANPEDFFVELAESLGMNAEQFRTDMNSKAARDAVSADLARANRLRLPGTPSFVINGERLENVGSLESLQAAVEAARQ